MPRKLYKNVGAEPILDDRQPGETFEANLPEDQEAYLKQIGALRVVSRKPKNKKLSMESAADRLAEEQEAAKRTPTD